MGQDRFALISVVQRNGQILHHGDGKRSWRSNVPDLFALHLSFGEEIGDFRGVRRTFKLAQMKVRCDEFGHATTRKG